MTRLGAKKRLALREAVAAARIVDAEKARAESAASARAHTFCGYHELTASLGADNAKTLRMLFSAIGTLPLVRRVDV